MAQRYDGADGAGQTVVVGLLCDPDLPEVLARDLAEVLPGKLADRAEVPRAWQVRIASDPFEAIHSDSSRLLDKAHQRVRDTDWDLAICLTDLPLEAGRRVLIASVSDTARVALVSLPALGGIALRRRAIQVVVPIIERLAAVAAQCDTAERPPGPSTGPIRGRRRSAALARPVTPADEDIDVEVAVPTGRGRLRLLAGMVRANRPWRLAGGLSLALAGGLAGSAFGVLYDNIWQLAVSLGWARLTVVAVAASAVLVGYLIIGHDLWERRGNSPDELGARLGLINVATLLTLGFGVFVFVTALIAINLATVTVVIPPDYLHGVLAKPVGWRDYLTLAVMASAMGTVAGAVGSGLENDATVRAAAYGSRGLTRRVRLRADGGHHSTS